MDVWHSYSTCPFAVTLFSNMQRAPLEDTAKAQSSTGSSSQSSLPMTERVHAKVVIETKTKRQARDVRAILAVAKWVSAEENGGARKGLNYEKTKEQREGKGGGVIT